MTERFDSKIHRGKTTIYVRIAAGQGICAVYDWNTDLKKYVKRTQGLRFYAYRKENGRQVSRCFHAFDEARRWRFLGPSIFEEEKAKKMTFGEVRIKYFEEVSKKVKPSTLETYQNNSRHLRFFEKLPASSIEPKTVDEWLREVKSPRYLELQHSTRSSYEHELQVLRNILSYYSEYLDDHYQLPFKKRHLRDSIIDPTSHKAKKESNRSRFIPPHDQELFLSTLLKSSEQKSKFYLFYLLALLQIRTGVRVGEAAALDFRDVCRETGKIVIQKTVFWARRAGAKTQVVPGTKSNRSRLVYAPSQFLDGLNHWQGHCGRSAGLIFSQDGFKPVGYSAIQANYNKAFAASGLPWASTHILRHTFGTDFLEKTENPHALKELLGHSDMRQTEHYAKTTETLVRRGVLAFHRELREREKPLPN